MHKSLRFLLFYTSILCYNVCKIAGQFDRPQIWFAVSPKKAMAIWWHQKYLLGVASIEAGISPCQNLLGGKGGQQMKPKAKQLIALFLIAATVLSLFASAIMMVFAN